MSIPTHPDALLSSDQVAILVGVEGRTIKRWDRSGKLPRAVKINGRKRWRMAAISEWIRDMEVAQAIEQKIAGTNPAVLGTNATSDQNAARQPKKRD